MARRNFTRSRGARKGTDWSASAVQTAFDTIPAASAVLLEVFTPIAGGETIIRTRGLLTYGSDQEAVTEGVNAAFGIGVVSEQAATVGITAVPHPGTDAAWDGWMYHTYMATIARIVTAASVDFNAVVQHVIDSKAARKVSENDRLVIVVENMSSSTGMLMSNSERLLSKIH